MPEPEPEPELEECRMSSGVGVAVTCDTVAELLADRSTRTATLDALEAHSGPHPMPLAMAAAAALTDLLCWDAAEVGHALFQRAGLLRARLLADAPPEDVAAIGGAMLGGGRCAAFYAAPSNVWARMFAKPVEELELTDALSCACVAATGAPRDVRGWTGVLAAAGFKSTFEWIGIIFEGEALVSKCVPSRSSERRALSSPPAHRACAACSPEALCLQEEDADRRDANQDGNAAA